MSQEEDDEEEDEDIEFEDVALPAPTIQTMELGSEDEDDEDDDIQLDDIDFSQLESAASAAKDDGPKDLELNLTAQQAALTPRRNVDRRKPITKAERERRVEIHKLHLLCLLYHAAQRNCWCNDPKAQETLRPLLSEKTVTYLKPGSNLSQFGQTESLKNGLQQAREMFNVKFEITERGLHRALWAENGEQLQNVSSGNRIEPARVRTDSCAVQPPGRHGIHAG